MAPDDLLTSGDIARLLGVSGARVRQLAQRPDFPAPETQAGGRRLWRRASVEAWLAGWERRSGRPPVAGSR